MIHLSMAILRIPFQSKCISILGGPQWRSRSRRENVGIYMAVIAQPILKKYVTHLCPSKTSSAPLCNVFEHYLIVTTNRLALAVPQPSKQITLNLAVRPFSPQDLNISYNFLQAPKAITPHSGGRSGVRLYPHNFVSIYIYIYIYKQVDVGAFFHAGGY